MAGNPCEKSIKILRWFVGRYGVPCFPIGVVFAFLRGGKIVYDSLCQRTQTTPVLFASVFDRRLRSSQIQLHNLVIIQGVSLLSIVFKGLHLNKRFFALERYMFFHYNRIASIIAIRMQLVRFQYSKNSHELSWLFLSLQLLSDTQTRFRQSNPPEED